MKYITTKRFKQKGMGQDFNLPFNTECEVINNTICYKNIPICYTTSQNAYDYFSRNDDSQGLYRSQLVQRIIKTLSNRDEQYQDRWNRLWANTKLYKFRRKDFNDYWIWGYEFYNADIQDLEYIYNLIKD